MRIDYILLCLAVAGLRFAVVLQASEQQQRHEDGRVVVEVPYEAAAAYARPSFSVPIISVPPTVDAGTVFPPSFAFGVSTSAYQVEGGWLEDGKGFSIWDVSSHIPGHIANGDTGDIADDFYHLYDADLAMMAANGITHFRMSISWPRIMPTGFAPVNPAGVAFYNRVFEACAKYGITPYVTLFHSDVPQNLVNYPRPGIAFLADDFPQIFADYADAVFAAFGTRVKNWMTFNEPWCSAVLGIDGGRDPYNVAHNILRAHALAVNVYRTKYQASQKGVITIVLNTAHFYAASSNPEDVAAAQRAYDFNLGWFADPILAGDYPASMRLTLGARLPVFNASEKALLKGSMDSIAINHYMPFLCKPGSSPHSDNPSYWSDENTTCFYDPSWPLSDFGWGIYAPGIKDLLLYVAQRYPGIPLWITENGVCAPGENNMTIAINDVMRQKYIHDYVENVGLALQQGAPVEKYFVWSILDNLEWGSGFSKHFGMVWIDRSTPALIRFPKSSLALYKNIVHTHIVKSKRIE
eukprot:ANDGO_05330.mRNA.1 Beta-glucosidase 1